MSRAGWLCIAGLRGCFISTEGEEPSHSLWRAMNVPKTMASRNVSRLESFALAGLLILQTAFVLSVISPVVPAVPVLLLPVVMLMSYLWIIGMSVPEHRDFWTDVME